MCFCFQSFVCFFCRGGRLGDPNGTDKEGQLLFFGFHVGSVCAFHTLAGWTLAIRSRSRQSTIRSMLKRTLFPNWLIQSKDRGKARTQSSEEGYYEAGNMVWEALYWLGGLYMLPFSSGLVEDRSRVMSMPRTGQLTAEEFLGQSRVLDKFSRGRSTPAG